ncbi:hypothetical protein CH298_13240 [Rhodococcoides fascians]|nr:hypothetical protein CH303_13120 [Rhodococcus fascians]OZF18482.1 hypothetical protein CH298_13240 [Rhodococcus fascians]OZF21916.1 hypothetical protein CH297_13135 [Rhodococcus fascians]OZF67535.1 hypothetical protein CH308_13035 [Rhodococcus fascians]OZF70729.1 hypothetical protein CH307_13230 [Rhodococcus fascians]
MPLPGLLDDTAYNIADFDSLRIVPAADLRTEDRIAVLSQEGVNLLSQRWVYHSSRVIVPTHTFDRQTFGPYNEADLCEEWVTDHPNGAQSAIEFDAWVRSGDPSRQSHLGDPQSASSVRRAMRLHLRSVEGS